MREIRMKTVSAGPNGLFGVGATRTVTDEEAAELVPVYADFTDGYETAALAPGEVATLATGETADLAPEEVSKRGRRRQA